MSFFIINSGFDETRLSERKGEQESAVRNVTLLHIAVKLRGLYSVAAHGPVGRMVGSDDPAA